MTELSIHAADLCSFLQATSVFQPLFSININKQGSSMDDINSQYLGRRPPAASFGGEWRLKRGVDSVLTRQYKSLRRGPSETLVLSGNQF